VNTQLNSTCTWFGGKEIDESFVHQPKSYSEHTVK